MTMISHISSLLYADSKNNLKKKENGGLTVKKIKEERLEGIFKFI